MLKKILIVEDDSFFREALKNLLQKKYTIIEAPNGKSAKEIMSVQDFTVDLVLSDIQMPGFTGLELLEWSLTNKPIPFVIMTGFSMIMETKSAFELGAKGFISKPFKNSELITIIENILKETEPKHATPSPNAVADEKQIAADKIQQVYCKVSIDEFVTKPKIDFDVYIKLSEEKVIKIAQKGQELPRERVKNYKEKGVKYLFILKEDFKKLVNFNMGLANLIKDRSDISPEKKMNFLKYTGEVLLERTFIDGLDRESFQEAKSFLELTMETVTDNKENFELLSLLSSHSDSVYAHSLGVSVYSVLIAKKLYLEAPSTIFKLSMAGLFHDIGKKELDREILEKPRALMTKDERAIVESHVLHSQEILYSMATIPPEVTQIATEHHEDQGGLGYPLRKAKKDQHPLSRIIQCANIFIDCTLGATAATPRTALQAITYMENFYGTRICADTLNALRIVFNLPKK